MKVSVTRLTIWKGILLGVGHDAQVKIIVQILCHDRQCEGATHIRQNDVAFCWRRIDPYQPRPRNIQVYAQWFCES